MAELISYEELIKMLGDNYRKIEQSIVNQILLNVSNHHPTQGSYRENVWKSLFEMIVPRKYCIDQGVFIIDSYGHKSREVDLVIFDEMYTPYIFNYGEIKFIPIEAVAAVVQCKSKEVKYENVSEWRKSIETLVTSMDSVARMSTLMIDNNSAKEKSATQTATRPIMIFCAVKPGDKNISRVSDLKKDFDIILSIDEKNKKLHKYIRGEADSLKEWNNSLNHALENNRCEEQIVKNEKEKRNELIKSITESQRENILQELKVEQWNKADEKTEEKLEENVLLSLIFQLNQLLMILNNPMLFPHRAYARCFDKILGEYKENRKDGK